MKKDLFYYYSKNCDFLINEKMHICQFQIKIELKLKLSRW